MRILITLFRDLDLDFWLYYLEILMGFLDIFEFLFILILSNLR